MAMPAALRRLGAVLLVALAIIVTIPVIAVLVLARTPWGHNETRRLALNAVHGVIHGTVSLGTIDGDLIDHLVVTNVTIADSNGAPLVRVARASLHYRLIDLLHRRLDFTDVRVDTPTVVLTESQDSVWNYRRIFPASPHPSDSAQSGFGSFIRLSGLRVIGGDLTVRTPWRPDAGLHGAARDSAIAVALDTSASRVAIARVPGGFEKTIAIHQLSAQMPAVRLADPATAVKTIQVASLRADAAVFRPPDVSIRDVIGTFYLDADSLW